jgi:hypothetical protein
MCVFEGNCVSEGVIAADIWTCDIGELENVGDVVVVIAVDVVDDNDDENAGS